MAILASDSDWFVFVVTDWTYILWIRVSHAAGAGSAAGGKQTLTNDASRGTDFQISEICRSSFSAALASFWKSNGSVCLTFRAPSDENTPKTER
jgi:hypothetical protein